MITTFSVFLFIYRFTEFLLDLTLPYRRKFQIVLFFCILPRTLDNEETQKRGKKRMVNDGK